jgi:hypothetical protein
MANPRADYAKLKTAVKNTESINYIIGSEVFV